MEDECTEMMSEKSTEKTDFLKEDTSFCNSFTLDLRCVISSIVSTQAVEAVLVPVLVPSCLAASTLVWEDSTDVEQLSLPSGAYERRSRV